MAAEFPGDTKGMIERARRLLLSPAEEFRAIDAEAMTVKGIYTGWVVPLAAIGPVAGAIGLTLFGYSFLGVSVRPGLTFALTSAVTGFLGALIGTYVMALIIDLLAPNFGATKSPIGALKAVAFSMTAAWLAGVLQILPSLSFLAILLSIYSIYLLWVGLPILMKAPAEKAAAYVAVSIAACIVAMVIVFTVTGAVTSAVTPNPASLVGGSSDVSGTFSVPGVGSVDLDKMRAAGDKMKAATDKMQADAASGHSSAVPADALQAMLPASIAGFTRGDVETQSGGAGGLNGSKAEARYSMGDQSFSLSVADVGALGAVATLGGAMNLQSGKTTATGYEKTVMVDGAMVSEKWNNQDHHGSYSTMVASRFAVDASGNAPSIDVLKAAVASVDSGKLAALAK